MTEQLRAPRPGQICDDCIRDCVLKSPTKDCVVVYCSHHATCGVYVIAEKQWHLVNPVEHDIFVEAMVTISEAVVKATVGGHA